MPQYPRSIHTRMGSTPLRSEDLAPDLQRRLVQDRLDSEETTIEYRNMIAVEASASINTLTRGLYGRSIEISTIPVLAIRAERLRSYLFKNPESVVGLVNEVTVKSSGNITTSGSSQATPIDVSSYREAHAFVNCTVINGASPNLRIYAQAQNPVSGAWVDTQQVFDIAAVGEYYQRIGPVGLTSLLAFRWEIWPLGASDATFSIGLSLKDGLPRSARTGDSQAIFLGPQGVTTDIGYPLLESQERPFYVKENVEIYAVAKTAGLILKVFEL